MGETTNPEITEATIAATLPESAKKRIVIIGGGFAGIELIRKLRGTSYQVVMIDRHNYHTFIPLLYQVATAGLSPGDVASPLREFLQNDEDFHFRLAGALEIDSKNKQVMTSKGAVKYDYLVIATGAVTNFYGNDKIEKSALKLRQVNDALKLRNSLIDSFEKALLSKDRDLQAEHLNVVIVGAGPTGVELAGAIGELRRHILPKDYPELDFTKMSICLVEGLDRVLPAMSEKAGIKAHKYLEQFGVEVTLGQMVEEAEGNDIVLTNGRRIKSNCLIWAAGVKGNIIEGLDEDQMHKSQYIVDDYNQVKNSESIYAIGDVSLQKNPGFDDGLPMLAPVAIQQAKHLGNNFRKLDRGKEMKPFRYFDKGTMATVGRNKAVVDIPLDINIGGFLGWFIWMFIHLFSIVGFRRKLLVFANWVWNYFTYNRGNRLIINPDKE